MKKFAKLFILIFGILTACDVEAQYSVNDSCTTVVVYNHGVSPTSRDQYNKTALRLSYVPHSTLSLIRVDQSTIVAKWTASNVHNLDSLNQVLSGYLSSGCLNVQCANAMQGPTGPTGATGAYGASDTIPLATGQFVPRVIELGSLDTAYADTATWTYQAHVVTVFGSIRIKVDTSGGITTSSPAMMLQIPFRARFANGNELNGTLGDTLGRTGTISSLHFAGLYTAYVRIQSTLDTQMSTYKYSYRYTTDTTISGYVVHEGPTGATGATGSDIYTTDGTLTGSRVVNTAGNDLTIGDVANHDNFIHVSTSKGLLFQSLHKGFALNTVDGIFTVQDTLGNAALYVDQLNSSVGINNNSPMAAFDVIGQVRLQSLSFYANDAAADADGSLPSGGLYRITGNRTVFIKP